MRITKLHGGLVPMSAVGTILGVSRQRVHQLADEGTFSVYEFYGMKWLLENEVVSFGKLNGWRGKTNSNPAKSRCGRQHENSAKISSRRAGQVIDSRKFLI